MDFVNEQVINLIWNIFFISITTIIICFLLLREDKNKKKVISVIAITMVLFVFVCILLISTKSISLGKINFWYEFFCWIFIIALSIHKYSWNKKISISINKTEKILVCVSIFIGLFSLFRMYNNNKYYIFPIKDYSYIENYYFNADIHRSISQISSADEVIHKIHPLYRFVTLPIILPILMFNKVLGYHQLGYIICVLQIIYNAISSIIMYRILKSENLKKQTCILGSLIFIFALPTMWMSILPETYSITTLMLLSFIYLYKKRNLSCVGMALFAVGTNLMAFVPIRTSYYY